MSRRRPTTFALWVGYCLAWIVLGGLSAEPPVTPSPPASPLSPATERVLVVLGDSLSAGFGVDPAEIGRAHV